MSFLSTEVQNSRNRVVFIRHDGFEKEVEKFSSKVRDFDQALVSLEKLLGIQFHPTSPQTVITPKNLHNVHKTVEYELWKVNCVATKGLKRSQMPRIYFARRASEIFFLCMASHIKNYDDAQLRSMALYRIQTFFDTNGE